MNDVPNSFPSLFWGYTAIWTILTVYVFLLLGRVRRLEKKLGGGK